MLIDLEVFDHLLWVGLFSLTIEDKYRFRSIIRVREYRRSCMVDFSSDCITGLGDY